MERGKEEGNERNEEPARCLLFCQGSPISKTAPWQTPGHVWIGGGYNSGSIGDVCWDGALAIIEQKHPRPILGCLVSQARGRCGAGASSPFLLLLFFRCAALPLRSSGLILVDTQRRQSNEECGIDPLEIDVWRSANQPTRACAAIPSVPVWANSDRGVEGGGPLAAMACAVTRVALLVRQGLVFQARSRAHEKVVVVPSVSWSWLGSGNHLQAMTSETTCAWFSALTVCSLAK